MKDAPTEPSMDNAAKSQLRPPYANALQGIEAPEEYNTLIESKRKELWDVFCQVDSDGDGNILALDVEKALKKIGT